MNIAGGIKLLEELDGEGRAAVKGDCVVFNLKTFLNRGDEVPLNETRNRGIPESMVRVEGGYRFIDHTIVLGKRRAIAAVDAGETFGPTPVPPCR